MGLLTPLREKKENSLFLMKLGKARSIWRHSKELEKTNPRLKRNQHELDFLPAALEIIEKPPSRTARATTWSIIGVFVFAVAWSIIGKTDIVIVAQGKTIPFRGSKPIQSLESGNVKALYVEEGQEVKKGDTLVELDTTDSEADKKGVAERLIPAMLDGARLKALYDNPGNPESVFRTPKMADARLVDTQRQLMQATATEFRSKQDNLDNEIRRAEAEMRGIRAEVSKLEQTIPLIEERAAGQMQLSDKGLLPRNQALQTQQELINARQTLNTQQARKQEIEASLASAKEQRKQVESEFRGNILLQLREAQEKVASLRQEFIKAENRFGFHKITAPEDGYVQQLSVTAVGTVVEAGKPILLLVPKGEVLEIEASLLGKDRADVDEGQEAHVKLEAFPFTKYGTIDAKIRSITADSIPDEKLGAVFRLRATLAKNTMHYEGKTFLLSPGMAVTLEIKAGNRRIIEFILSPILRGFKEAAREK